MLGGSWSVQPPSGLDEAEKTPLRAISESLREPTSSVEAEMAVKSTRDLMGTERISGTESPARVEGGDKTCHIQEAMRSPG